MTTPDQTPLHHWADRLEAHLPSLPRLALTRVVVLAETASTQDAAARHAAHTPGLLCIAVRQTGGRGRLGRPWADNLGKGLALTLAMGEQAATPHLSLAAGLAVASALAAPGLAHRVGLRWPNDAVDRITARKLAGVLIERQQALTLLGIGINTHQSEDDWRAANLTTAISLAQLGQPTDRLELALSVLTELDAALAESPQSLARKWLARDTLTGTHQRFSHAGQTYEGIVESIDPSSTLIIRTNQGLARLPALTTSLVHEAP